MESGENWKWYAGADGELFDIGPCETKEGAISEAKDSECGYDWNINSSHILSFELIEAVQSPIKLSDFLSAETFFDDLTNNYEWFYDNNCDEAIITPKKQELEELTLLFKQALDGWQDKYYPELKTRIFTNQRNREKIYMRSSGEDNDYAQISLEQYLEIASSAKELTQ